MYLACLYLLQILPLKTWVLQSEAKKDNPKTFHIVVLLYTAGIKLLYGLPCYIRKHLSHMDGEVDLSQVTADGLK